MAALLFCSAFSAVVAVSLVAIAVAAIVFVVVRVEAGFSHTVSLPDRPPTEAPREKPRSTWP